MNTKQTTMRVLLAAGLSVAMAAPAWAAGSREELNFQAQLADQNGVPLNGTYDITIAIFDAATDGNQIHTETFADTEVERGVYNVKMGSTAALPEGLTNPVSTASLWMQVTVDDGEGDPETLLPRQKLSSSLWAVNADMVDGFSAEELRQGKANFRWAVWSSYSQNCCWMYNNDSNMLGGVHGSTWGDGNGVVWSMGPSFKLLRNVFNKKGYAGANATIWSDEWYPNSSTNSKHAAVLFRVRNDTSSAINWTPCWYYSSYGGWSERASASINGSGTWQSGGSNCGTNCTTCQTFSVPANRVSTIIIASASGSNSGTRPCGLAFYNNRLNLPAGLTFVDDLDTATGNWR